MNIPRLGPIADGLIHEAEMPFCWQIIHENISSLELLNLHESNRLLLQLMLKEGAVQEPDAISDPIAREMTRLDSKLDLLITLVGTLLSRETGIPAYRKVWLGSEGFQVLLESSAEDAAALAELPVIPFNEYTPESSASDCLVKVSMFLDTQFPLPLNFYTRITIVKQAGADSLMVATFENKDPEVQDLLEKFIFQQHRRVIASARTQYSEH